MERSVIRGGCAIKQSCPRIPLRSMRATNPSVNCPQSRRRQLQKMPVGVAKIDAFAAARPFRAPLDRDAMRGKARLPFGKLVAADRKGDVQRAVTIVGRDGTARHAHGFKRETATKDEQYAAPADIISVEPLIAGERVEPQNLTVEARRALKIIHIERRLEHAFELRHGYHMLSVARASSDIRV